MKHLYKITYSPLSSVDGSENIIKFAAAVSPKEASDLTHPEYPDGSAVFMGELDHLLLCQVSDVTNLT